MESDTPHLLVETGPEKGRELTIPAKGARLGRAVENDITIADATMSRFQCRLYFRDSFLHVMDLGSTNETLVNNSPVSDTILRFGDELLIGESVLKIINDGLHEDSATEAAAAPAPAEDAEPAPIIFYDGDEPSSEPETAPEPPAKEKSALDSVMDVDLGLGKRNLGDDPENPGERKSVVPLVLVALVTLLIVVGAGVAVLFSTGAPASAGTNGPVPDSRILVDYEKVISGEGNVFRYAIDLTPGGVLTADVHDLAQERDISRQETLDTEPLKSLRDQLLSQKDSFLSLQDSYEGLPVGDHEAYRLTLIFGREAKTVHIENQVEPDAFRQIREQIEAFANNELGLININIPPAELRARATESWQNAQDLYARRDVKNENLWQASQKLKDVVFLLETIEPKPDYYEDAVLLGQDWRQELNDKLSNLDFNAVRAYRIGNLSEARDYYRQILATFPDRTSSTYKQAQRTLIQIEQELN